MTEESSFRYNKGLADRFVSDFKMPIAMTQSIYFPYFLQMYEAEYGSLRKWNALWKMIDERYDGNPEKFLDDYYNVRDRIINDVLENPAFKEFNTGDMSRFVVKDAPNVSKNSVYNQTYDGKILLSVDLRKANFQALKYVNKDIVFGADSYRDFIHRWTDLDYVAESKYSRQVIWGKCNPSRQITVEKFLINEVRKTIETGGVEITDGLKLTLVSMSNDELVYMVDGFGKDYYSEDAEVHFSNTSTRIEETALKQLGLEVSTEIFKLDMHELLSKPSYDAKEKHRTTFYTREDLITGDVTMKGVPLPYHAIVYKIFNGFEPQEEDYHFIYEGIDCTFNEDFYIKSNPNYIKL